jgi:hypothetical protein
MDPTTTLGLYKYRLEAGKLLKEAMRANCFTYRELADLLTKDGLPHTKANLVNKVSRGTFSAAFLMRCLALLRKAEGGGRPTPSFAGHHVPRSRD